MEAGIQASASLAKGNIALVSEKCTVGEFLSVWLERKRPEVRPGTITLYRAIAARVIPILGEKRMQDLRPIDVDSMVWRLAGNGLARSTLSVTLTVFRNALAEAVYPFNMISSNPAQYMKVPTHRSRKTCISTRRTP